MVYSNGEGRRTTRASASHVSRVCPESSASCQTTKKIIAPVIRRKLTRRLERSLAWLLCHPNDDIPRITDRDDDQQHDRDSKAMQTQRHVHRDADARAGN